MALPSPHFVTNAPKPVPLQKPHVKSQESMKPNRFIAFCKFCQEGFKSESDLFQHRKSHERCPYDDCKFNANDKTVAEHVQRVHLKSNTLVKIQDLITPEQIEKWRDERRKRYPTTSNVLLRQQAQEERFQRGEKLQPRQQRFGDFKQRNFINNADKKQPQKHGKDSNPKRPYTNDTNKKIWPQRDFKKPRTDKPNDKKPATVVETHVVKAENIDEDSENEQRATPSFKGTSQMKDYHEVDTLVKEQAALSILGMYGSDSNTEDEIEPTETTQDEPSPVKVIEVETNKAETAREHHVLEEGELEVGEMSDNEDIAPDEAPIEHADVHMQPEPCESLEGVNFHKRTNNQFQPQHDKKRPPSALDYSKLFTRRPVNPFLEKLLQEDIRHERSVLLQCVNFVVRNNFFEELPATNDTETTTEQLENIEIQKVDDN